MEPYPIPPTIPQHRPLAVLTDFDGTLTQRDVAEHLLDTFASPDWRMEGERWRKGQIPTHRDLLQREYSYFHTDRHEEMVRYALKTTALREGALEFVDFCTQKGIPLEIVSGGVDFYIKPLLRQYGLAHLPLCSMTVAGATADGSMLADYPEGTAVCDRLGCCKCPRIEHYRKLGYTTVFIGDGSSDRCAAPQADVLFARGPLARYCAEQSIPFIPYDTFHDVLAALRPIYETIQHAM
ncbi:MAG: MtnX-like HAD-IB family phosphatase [Chloroflexi bacterium]|nr:MtnX-like HAD-IB family phosphatase [Chloroflexota bacterium]